MLARLPAPLRHGTHLQTDEVAAGVDCSAGPPPRAGGALDLAADRRLRPAPPRPRPGSRPAPPLGTTTPPPTAADALPGPAAISSSAGRAGPPGTSAETPPPRPGAPARRQEHPSPASPPR